MYDFIAAVERWRTIITSESWRVHQPVPLGDLGTDQLLGIGLKYDEEQGVWWVLAGGCHIHYCTDRNALAAVDPLFCCSVEIERPTVGQLNTLVSLFGEHNE